MKVITNNPIVFEAGDTLAPEDLNKCFLYAKDALEDVSQRRWAKGMIVYPFVEDVGTAYTQAMNVEERTYRFTSPVNCVIERGYFHGDFTATPVAGDTVGLRVDLTTAGGAVPAGATAPYLQTGATAVASATTDTSDANLEHVALTAGTEYKFIVSIAAGGVFTLNRFDLILHVAVDRWSTGGTLVVPFFDPTLFVDGFAGGNAVNVNANITSLNTQAALLANAKTAPMPILIALRHGTAATPFVSGLSINLRKFTIPRVASARCRMVLKRCYLYAYTAGAVTISATLKDNTGAAVASFGVAGTLSCVVPAGGQASVDSGALNIALDGGVSATTASDYTIELANSSAGTNCIKAYAVAWVARI
jgi:hypothetical protein